ncbi:MAG: hypothetical protein K2X81_14695, partial [Candidatus Obscuribacterales bacterium]|nr:hypothetical protein [Candidatus Obscuribacterales bacterium]
MDISQLKETLQETLEFPHTKSQKLLADILNGLDPQEFEEVVNSLLDQVTRAEVKQFGLSHFAQIDRYPNPSDGLLSKDEISESLHLTVDSKERAILLWIWLNFDEIRQSSEDATG